MTRELSASPDPMESRGIHASGSGLGLGCVARLKPAQPSSYRMCERSPTRFSRILTGRTPRIAKAKPIAMT